MKNLHPLQFVGLVIQLAVAACGAIVRLATYATPAQTAGGLIALGIGLYVVGTLIKYRGQK